MTRCNNTGELPTKKKKTTTRVNNERLKWFDSKKKEIFLFSRERRTSTLFFLLLNFPLPIIERSLSPPLLYVVLSYEALAE